MSNKNNGSGQIISLPQGGDATDVEQYGLAEIQDPVLALEYETTPEFLST
jgi:hypothetical protein